MFSDIVLNRLGDPISVKVRKSKKAKHFSIRILGNIVELVMPNSDIGFGLKLLESRESWIRKKMHISAYNIPTDPNKIPIFGKEYLIEHIIANYYKVEIKGSNIIVHSTENHHNKTLIKFLKDKLLEEINHIASDLSETYDFHYSKIRIMNNKTKWGSCSSDRVLSFHWRMIFAPKNILHYLVIHEMCHLVHMNHSSDFWNMVESIDHDYKASRKWLKLNSALLNNYLS